MENIRVILADEHPIIRSSLLRLLSTEDIEVVAVCESGQETINAVEKYLPQVLVLDDHLKDVEAKEILKQLIKANLTTHFLILSGCVKKETIEALLREGACGYVAKDEAIEWLVPSVRGIMKGAVCLSPMIKDHISG